MEEPLTRAPAPAKLHSGHRDRVRRRFLQHGGGIFHEDQLLELLLFYACPRRDTLPIAQALLARFGGFQEVLHASLSDLKQVHGVGENTAIFLQAVGLASRKKEDLPPRVPMDTTHELGSYLSPYFVSSKEEQLYFLCGDGSNQLLSCDLIAQGDEDRVSLNERILGAYIDQWQPDWIVFAHGHPSGILYPSEEDVKTTHHCKKYLAQRDVDLRDHLIFSQGDFCSMRDLGFL